MCCFSCPLPPPHFRRSAAPVCRSFQFQDLLYSGSGVPNIFPHSRVKKYNFFIIEIPRNRKYSCFLHGFHSMQPRRSLRLAGRPPYNYFITAYPQRTAIKYSFAHTYNLNALLLRKQSIAARCFLKSK